MGGDENSLGAYQCKKKKNKNYDYLVCKGGQLCCADCQCSHVSVKYSTVRCKKALHGILYCRINGVLVQGSFEGNERGVALQRDVQEMIEAEVLVEEVDVNVTE